MYKLKLFLRNNKFTSRLYYKLFKLKSVKKGKNLQKYQKEITKDIYNVFEDVGIEYTYAFGSLLGIIRDKGFMPHDDDVDIMVMNDENKIGLLINELEKNGFKLIHYCKVDSIITEYTFLYKNTGLTIDVFINFKTNDNLLTTYWLYQDANKHYKNKNQMSVSMTKKCDISDYKYVNYWGVDLRVPKNAEEVLYWNYGEKWMIKDPNYSPKKSPGFVATERVGEFVNC